MRPSFRAFLSLAFALGIPAGVQAADDAQCRASATQATGYTPGSSTPSGPDGDRLAGAARGAAAGAVVGGAQGNQYGNAPDALQDQHRENQAKSGAKAGMVAGGSRHRRERRDERRTASDNEAAWKASYDTCMKG
jgi:hypothetical protein